MGDCYIVRKGGSSSGGTGFNYVDGNCGIMSLPGLINYLPSTFNGSNYIDLQGSQLNITKGQSITAEVCFKLSSTVTRNARYVELGSLQLCIAHEYIGNKYWLDLGVGGSWQIALENTYELYANQDVTYSMVINDSAILFYINGVLTWTINGYTNQLLNTISISNIYLMGGTDSARACAGNFYAFRFYNKALTASEIAQNYQEDLKLIALVNGS